MPIITLTTDFGLADSYVAAMKGVILRIAPQATVIDITHHIAPQDVAEAAYVLSTVLSYFTPDTVHVVVVDPGVGSARRPLAVRTTQATLVGPDNGVFTDVLQAHPEAVCVHLNRPDRWLAQVSATFHGRDLFSPVAAHLANGATLEQLGAPIDDPVLLPRRAPQRNKDGSLRGEIVHVDHFGNLISNIPGAWLAGGQWIVHVAGRDLASLKATYADAIPGEIIALVSSAGSVEIAVREGSAAQRLAAGLATSVELRPQRG